MTFIASYWFIWAGLFITFTALAARKQLKLWKDASNDMPDMSSSLLVNSSSNLSPLDQYRQRKAQSGLLRTDDVTNKSFFSGLTSLTVLGLLASGSGILLAISIVVNIIDYAKLH